MASFMSLYRTEKVRLALLLCFLLFWPIKPALPADSATSNYLKVSFQSSTHEPQSLDTSIVSLKGRDKNGAFMIDLVSAVHVADRSYYAELNRRFQSYDSVLFELIASKEAADKFSAAHKLSDEKSSSKRSDQQSEVSLIQDSLAGLLDLSFQLKQIDYSASNFIHADMSPEELTLSMQNKGESFSQIMLRAVSQSLKQQDKKAPSDLSDLFLLLSSGYRPIGLKRMIARQFNDLDQLVQALNGAEGSSLIHGRNSIAVKKSYDRIDMGDRKVAIFYGAAHMQDMFSQLNSRFELDPPQTYWLKAWNLNLVD